MHSAEGLLEVRENLPGLVLLAVELSVQRLVFSVRPRDLVHERLLERVELLLELLDLVQHRTLHVLQSLLEDLVPALLNPHLVVLLVLLLLLDRYLLLHMLSQQMHLLLCTLRLHSGRRVLAQGILDL